MAYQQGHWQDEQWRHPMVDQAGSDDGAYVTGWTYSSDFPTTMGAFQPSLGGSLDAFVAKLNPSGSSLLYSTYLGGSDAEGGGIAVDAAGSAYVTGVTFLGDFPTTAGAFQTSFGGGFDTFVAKLNPSGASLVYSTYLGGSDDDRGDGVAVDGAGSAYVTGVTGSDFPTTAGALQPSPGGSEDVFVAKLNPLGREACLLHLLGRVRC